MSPEIRHATALDSFIAGRSGIAPGDLAEIRGRQKELTDKKLRALKGLGYEGETGRIARAISSCARKPGGAAAALAGFLAKALGDVPRESAGSWKPKGVLGCIVEIAGFEYFASEDIIISTMLNLQRAFGYCELFDETSIGIGSIIDSEPIRFECGGWEWMIELWKGQYGIETGCEIGVYRRKAGVPPSELEQATGKIYDCESDECVLPMAFALKSRKDSATLITRDAEHWWLTGFEWGLFHEPEDLVMEARISFKDAEMRDAFVRAIESPPFGYRTNAAANAVSFVFDSPRSAQPPTRNKLREDVQRINSSMVAAYNEMKACEHIGSNDPNEIERALLRPGAAAESKAMIEWMIQYFTNRSLLGE